MDSVTPSSQTTAYDPSSPVLIGARGVEHHILRVIDRTRLSTRTRGGLMRCYCGMDVRFVFDT